jgi:glycosyltransferase involved in cell wall biosynthesis
VTASLPYPPASGGALRAYGIIQGLHNAGHCVTLLSFGDDGAVGSPLEAVCERVITVPPSQRSTRDRLKTLLLSRRADIEDRLYSHAFKNTLVWLTRETPFDLIQFEGIEVAGYLPVVRKQSTGACLCFDTFNAEADLQHTIYQIDRDNPRRLPAALYSWIQSRRIRRYEGDLCRMADLVIAVSDEDAALLAAYDTDAPLHVVPSGIFTADYAPNHADESVTLPGNSLVYTGKMDYRPNVDAMLWFTDEILPHIPNAHLTIVGQKPHARIQHLPQESNIDLTGWVDRIPPYLHAADVYIAPLRMGSGTRLKLLEAMASGCAIVATSIAAAGLNDAVKSALVLADDAPAFAEAVQHLLKHPDIRRDMGRRASEQVAAHYDWSVLIPRLLAAYKETGLG